MTVTHPREYYKTVLGDTRKIIGSERTDSQLEKARENLKKRYEEIENNRHFTQFIRSTGRSIILQKKNDRLIRKTRRKKKENFNCKKCKKYFNSWRQLQDHKKSRGHLNKVTDRYCPTCHVRVNGASQYTAHINSINHFKKVKWSQHNSNN